MGYVVNSLKLQLNSGSRPVSCPMTTVTPASAERELALLSPSGAHSQPSKPHMRSFTTGRVCPHVAFIATSFIPPLTKLPCKLGRIRRDGSSILNKPMEHVERSSILSKPMEHVERSSSDLSGFLALALISTP
ncbi:hypothetical protein ANANG_G00042600 [Anguilla anguilla]|uniref:Uncharacterized protein n=1 Tax=Anguilla anguilla TaxID=7936 RepID=A0A9D3MXM4_ANGAN|nr:hypothetical protein ANANG_G00042600 [Anguilla anguilla]